MAMPPINNHHDSLNDSTLTRAAYFFSITR